MTDIDTHVEGLIYRACGGGEEYRCDFSGFWLLAEELEAARKVVADVVVTERDAKYAYFVCRMCGGMWRDDEPNGHRENCAAGAYDRVMEAMK